MARTSSTASKPQALAWPAEVAETLGIPEQTLAQWRSLREHHVLEVPRQFGRRRQASPRTWLATALPAAPSWSPLFAAVAGRPKIGIRPATCTRTMQALVKVGHL